MHELFAINTEQERKSHLKLVKSCSVYHVDFLSRDDLNGIVQRSEVDAKWTFPLRRRFLALEK